jgi:hypothetical protein
LVPILQCERNSFCPPPFRADGLSSPPVEWRSLVSPNVQCRTAMQCHHHVVCTYDRTHILVSRFMPSRLVCGVAVLRSLSIRAGNCAETASMKSVHSSLRVVDGDSIHRCTTAAFKQHYHMTSFHGLFAVPSLARHRPDVQFYTARMDRGSLRHSRSAHCIALTTRTHSCAMLASSYRCVVL